MKFDTKDFFKHVVMFVIKFQSSEKFYLCCLKQGNWRTLSQWNNIRF